MAPAVLLSAAIMVMQLQLGCGQGAEPIRSRTSERPSILLLTIDALRADHLSFAGYPRQTSPFLDTLQADGATFDRAYSTSSWTVPALTTLATGLYPPSHGVVHGTGLDSEGLPLNQESISSEFPMLASELRQLGYRTYGIVANLHGHENFGFGRGFDRYRCVGFSEAQAVHQVLAEWRDEIASSSASGPVFVWLHYFDPHWPYFDRAPWSRQFKPELPLDALPRVQRMAATWLEGPPKPVIRTLGETIEFARVLYDAEIAYADDWIRRAFGELPMMAEWFTIITADHGEEFLDHGELGHSMNLFEETVRVPFVLRGPGIPAGARQASVISLVDVPPTLVTVAGGQVPPSWQGLPLVTAEGRLRTDLPGQRSVLTFLDRSEDRRHRRALIGPRFKLITGDTAQGRWLYDLQEDPLERIDLSGLDSVRLNQLAADLEAVVAGLAPPPALVPSVALTEEQVQQLQELGYVE